MAEMTLLIYEIEASPVNCDMGQELLVVRQASGRQVPRRPPPNCHLVQYTRLPLLSLVYCTHEPLIRWIPDCATSPSARPHAHGAGIGRGCRTFDTRRARGWQASGTRL